MRFLKDSLRVNNIMARQCLGLRRDESVHILYDEKSEEISTTLQEALEIFSKKVSLIKVDIGHSHGKELSRRLCDEVMKADVIIDVTSKSIYYSGMRNQLCRMGARFVGMSGIDYDIFMRTVNIDYSLMRRISERIRKILNKTSLVEISTQLGTRINFQIEENSGFADIGQVDRLGSFGSLPAGEVIIKPKANSAEGVIVFDKMVDQIGLLNVPITAFVMHGEIKHVEGGEQAYQFLKMMHHDSAGHPWYLLEFGIGINEKAQMIGKIVEASKSKGGIKFMFGKEFSNQKECLFSDHYSGVVSRATVRFDGITIMKEGKLQLND